ncbi:MAG: hypothetical protein ACYSUL_14230 [Planctomycetota bacterium]|jgi:hypothetical protein
MNPKDIDNLIKKLYIKTSAELDGKINDQINALAESQKSQPATKPNIWRIIMKSKITKLAAAVSKSTTIQNINAVRGLFGSKALNFRQCRCII